MVPPEEYVCDAFRLRCYRTSDAESLSEATTSSYEHLERFMPWATATQTGEESTTLVRRFRAHWLLNKDFVVAVFDPSDTVLLGGTGFHLRDATLADQTAEIGMWIRSSEAGKGLGTAVLNAMLSWGFSHWPWLRLSWHCDVENAASIRLAEKAGMTREGVLRSHCVNHHGTRRDTVLFATLKSEWTG